MMLPRLFDVPMVSCTVAEVSEVNDLLVAWGHRLGPCNRPFTQVGYVLLLDGAPISCAMSASTVGTTAGGYRRQEVVELARLCSAPPSPWASRVMLRLWREACGPRWPHWPVVAAVSYQQNIVPYNGNLYRFDGWRRVSEDCGATTNTNHGRPAYAENPAARGSKSLWVWRYVSVGKAGPNDHDDHGEPDRGRDAPAEQRPSDAAPMRGGLDPLRDAG